MSKRSIARRDDEAGQTMAEYAVVLGVITITIVATFSAFSDAVLTALRRTVEIVTGVT